MINAAVSTPKQFPVRAVVQYPLFDLVMQSLIKNYAVPGILEQLNMRLNMIRNISIGEYFFGQESNQLSGVTMQEPGVSRLVTVDVEEAAAMAAI